MGLLHMPREKLTQFYYVFCPCTPQGGNLVCEFLNTDGEWIVNAASDCAAVGIRKARTMAFITVVTSEIMRAFTVRTSNPFYHGMTKNKPLLAAVSLYVYHTPHTTHHSTRLPVFIRSTCPEQTARISLTLESLWSFCCCCVHSSSVLAVCAIAVPGLRSSLFNFEGLEWHVILLALGLTLVPFVSDEVCVVLPFCIAHGTQNTPQCAWPPSPPEPAS